MYASSDWNWHFFATRNGGAFSRVHVMWHNIMDEERTSCWLSIEIWFKVCITIIVLTSYILCYYSLITNTFFTINIHELHIKLSPTIASSVKCDVCVRSLSWTRSHLFFGYTTKSVAIIDILAMIFGEIILFLHFTLEPAHGTHELRLGESTHDFRIILLEFSCFILLSSLRVSTNMLSFRVRAHCRRRCWRGILQNSAYWASNAIIGRTLKRRACSFAGALRALNRKTSHPFWHSQFNTPNNPITIIVYARVAAQS